MKTILLIFSCIFLITWGCGSDTNSVDSSPPLENETVITDPGTTIIDGGTSGDYPQSALTSEGCYADGVDDLGSSNTNYYTFSPIVIEGDSKWNSGGLDQGLFTTDGRLRIRLIANPSPGKIGGLCDYYVYPSDSYTKLRAKVGIRTPGATNFHQTHTFEFNVGQCSAAYDFTTFTGGQYEVVIQDVQWDTTCKSYGENYCPFWNVYNNHCVEMEMQMVTDVTTNFP